MTDVTARVREIVRAASERIKVAGDILDYAAFFLPDDQITYDEKALNQHIRKPEANALLRKMGQHLEMATFEAKAMEEMVRNFAESEGVKVLAINQPLRVAVTGKTISFGAYETLALLGRERCLARIDRALARTS